MKRRSTVACRAWLRFRVAALVIPTVVAGCAPDSVRNYAATGFNGYLQSLQAACPNLQIGNNNIGLWMEYNAVNDQYNYWLDMTSKLYYSRISPAQYRDEVTGQLGTGSFNARSFDCIIGNLPADRASAPPPTRITY